MTETELTVEPTREVILDFFYDIVDSRLKADKFEEMDNMLKALSEVKLESVGTILAFLTATLPAKSKLPERKTFLEAYRHKLTPDLLKGLE